MADYQCFPLWEATGNAVGNLNPKDLPISTILQSMLMAWAIEFDGTLNMEDPTQSGFSTDEEQELFRRKGIGLARQLQEELGPNYCIITSL
jgi:hypothetical protein